ncbi:MAG: Gfo/Idh/MocA family oxidoreductase [Verrucomicrobiota bacterium JB022]|nr:Gfo/Idh/MocA family oxidoreductase [Verrucomicrobiota bacterium JB022]
MAQTLRIGLIGAGANTRARHIPGFQALDGVEIVTVANRTPDSARAVANQFGIPRVAPDWRAVINDPEVDAVCIGTWPYMHSEIAIAALQAGKHVLTEARMASDTLEAERMVAASHAHQDLVAQIVPSPFTLDYDATVIRLIEEGRLGDVREIRVTHTHAAFADSLAALTWRQNMTYSGVNMLTLGIYHEVILRWFPDDLVDEVRAHGAIYTPRRYNEETEQEEDVKLPDSLTVAGTLESGTQLRYHFSGIESGRGRNEIILSGSLATLRVDVGAGKLWWAEAGSTEERPVEIPQTDRRGWRVEEDFVNSILYGNEIELTCFEDGLEYMRFTEAVYDSWKAGGDARSPDDYATDLDPDLAESESTPFWD